MAKVIKGITVEIGGNATPLNHALNDVNKTSKNLQSELRTIDKLLKLDPTNVELLNQKQEVLSESISTTEEKLRRLKHLMTAKLMQSSIAHFSEILLLLSKN